MRTVRIAVDQPETLGRAAARHRPGDLGWVVRRTASSTRGSTAGASASRRWSPGSFRNSSPTSIARRSRCWIAELDGGARRLVFVVPASRRVAQLRLLLVDPRARGRGLGTRLVRESIDFARAQGYARLVLWTQSNLAAARAIYRACGFELRKSEPHAAFGVKLTGEYWENRCNGRCS